MLLFKFLSKKNYVFVIFGNYIEFLISFEVKYIYSGYKYNGMGQSV